MALIITPRSGGDTIAVSTKNSAGVVHTSLATARNNRPTTGACRLYRVNLAPFGSKVKVAYVWETRRWVVQQKIAEFLGIDPQVEESINTSGRKKEAARAIIGRMTDEERESLLKEMQAQG